MTLAATSLPLAGMSAKCHIHAQPRETEGKVIALAAWRERDHCQGDSQGFAASIPDEDEESQACRGLTSPVTTVVEITHLSVPSATAREGHGPGPVERSHRPRLARVFEHRFTKSCARIVKEYFPAGDLRAHGA